MVKRGVAARALPTSIPAMWLLQELLQGRGEVMLTHYALPSFLPPYSPGLQEVQDDACYWAVPLGEIMGMGARKLGLPRRT